MYDTLMHKTVRWPMNKYLVKATPLNQEALLREHPLNKEMTHIHRSECNKGLFSHRGAKRDGIAVLTI